MNMRGVSTILCAPEVPKNYSYTRTNENRSIPEWNRTIRLKLKSYPLGHGIICPTNPFKGHGLWSMDLQQRLLTYQYQSLLIFFWLNTDCEQYISHQWVLISSNNKVFLSRIRDFVYWDLKSVYLIKIIGFSSWWEKPIIKIYHINKKNGKIIF